MSKISSSELKLENKKSDFECSHEKDLKQQEETDDNVEEDECLLSKDTSAAKASEKPDKNKRLNPFGACWEPKMRTILTTHVNVFLYATCFWIQIGVLPVSMAF